FLRERVDVVAENEADSHDEIHALGGQQPKARLSVRRLGRLDVVNRGAELVLGAQRAGVGAVVEGLVAAPADVEDDADAQGIRRGSGFSAPRPDEKKADVNDE